MHYSVLLFLASSAIAAPLANPEAKGHKESLPQHANQQPLPLACTDSKKWPSASRIHTLDNKNLAQVIDPSLCLNHKGKDGKPKNTTLYKYDAKANRILKHSVAKAPDYAKATCRQILDVSLLNYVMESKDGVCDQLDKQLKPLRQKKDDKKVNEIAGSYKSLYDILNDPKNHVFVERSLGKLKKQVMNRSTEVPEYKFKPNASDPQLFPRLQAVYQLVNQTEKTAHAIAKTLDQTLKKSFNGSKMNLTSVLDHAILFAKDTTKAKSGAPVPPVPAPSSESVSQSTSVVKSAAHSSAAPSAVHSSAAHSSVAHSSAAHSSVAPVSSKAPSSSSTLTHSSAAHSSVHSSAVHSKVHSSADHSSAARSSVAHSSVAPVSSQAPSSSSTLTHSSVAHSSVQTSAVHSAVHSSADHSSAARSSVAPVSSEGASSSILAHSSAAHSSVGRSSAAHSSVAPVSSEGPASSSTLAHSSVAHVTASTANVKSAPSSTSHPTASGSVSASSGAVHSTIMPPAHSITQ